MKKLSVFDKCKMREGIDYTEEIKRCLDFIFHQHRRGRSWRIAFEQAENAYGYPIVENARQVIKRNLDKNLNK